MRTIDLKNVFASKELMKEQSLLKFASEENMTTIDLVEQTLKKTQEEKKKKEEDK